MQYAAQYKSPFWLLCEAAGKARVAASTRDGIGYALDAARINAGHTLQETGAVKLGELVPDYLHPEYDRIAYASIADILCARDLVNDRVRAWFTKQGYRF